MIATGITIGGLSSLLLTRFNPRLAVELFHSNLALMMNQVDNQSHNVD